MHLSDFFFNKIVLDQINYFINRESKHYHGNLYIKRNIFMRNYIPYIHIYILILVTIFGNEG